MNNNLLVIFIVLNFVNVIIQTIKSLATVKCGKLVAALVNAIAYGLYTIVVVYMVCELPLMLKVVIIGLANFIGVYLVKLLEEKAQKDKLWKVEATFDHDEKVLDVVRKECERNNVPMNYIDLDGRWYVCNFFCATKAESTTVKQLCEHFNGRFFASESKAL